MIDVNEILYTLGYGDWDGDMDVLVCPCGYTIEHDGMCPQGHVSPLVEMGMI